MLACTLQGYNLEIKHIRGKKNPADSQIHQFVADALVRKGSVKDANAEYVQKLRMNELANDQDIQKALHQLCHSRPKGNQDPQGQSVLTETCPQGNCESEASPSVIAAIAISKIQLDNTLKNSLYSFLQNESTILNFTGAVWRTKIGIRE